MNRKIALLVILVAAIAALVLWAADPGPEPEAFEDSSATTEEAIESDETPEELSAVGTDEEPITGAAQEGLNRADIPAPGEEADTNRRFFRARVVDKATTKPIAGATVRYMEYAIFFELSSTDQRAFQKLSVDPERQLEKFGKHEIADQNGYVRLPRTMFYGACVGIKGELYGTANINSQVVPPEDGFVIELETDVRLRVHVVDSSGKDAAEVAIIAATMNRYPGNPTDYPHVLQVGKTDAKGILEVKHLQTKSKYWVKNKEGHKIARVALKVAGHDDFGIEFDATDPPKEAIEFELPVTGRVVVRSLDPNGKPIDTLPNVHLRLAKPRTTIEKTEDPLRKLLRNQIRFAYAQCKDGIAAFEHVLLGERWIATTNHQSQKAKKEFDGPRRAGEEVKVSLRFDDLGVLIVGQAMDADDAPIKHTQLTATLTEASKKRPTKLSCKSNGSGGFSFVVSKKLVGKLFGTIEISTGGNNPWANSTPLVAVGPEIGELQVGARDIGKLVLKKQPLILAAKLEDQNGQPIGQAWGTVEVLKIRTRGKKRPTETWQPNGKYVMAKAGGTIEIRGKLPTERVRFRVYSQTHLPIDPVEFTPGTDDLVIRLDSGGQLRVELLVDENKITQPYQTFILNLVRADVQPVEASGSNPTESPEARVRRMQEKQRERGQFIEQKPNRLSFQWPGRRAGRYRLEIRTAIDSEPLDTADIEIEDGQPTHREVDLRGRLNYFNITLLDTEGKPVKSSGHGVFVRAKEAGKAAKGVSMTKGKAAIVTSGDVVDILVTLKGYRDRKIDGIDRDTEIRLLPPLRAVLRPTGIEDLPKDIAFTLSIRRKPGTKRKLAPTNPMHFWNSMPGRFGSQQPKRATKGVPKGATVFEIGRPGEFTVTATLRRRRPGKARPPSNLTFPGMMPRTSRARGGSTRIQKITPSSIEVADDPAPQEFSIKIDPKELKKAIAQLEKREEQIKKRLEARKKARK